MSIPRCLSLTIALLVAPAAYAAPLFFSATLDGPSESPPVPSPGTGFANVSYDPVSHLLSISASFSGLVGTTTASHIHAPTAVPLTGTAGVATQTPSFVGFPLGVTSGSFSNTLDLTLSSSFNPAFVTANGGTPASAEAAFASALIANRSYFNIHTTSFPGGEIRGFLVAVPDESSTALLLMMALPVLWVGRKYRRTSSR